MAVDSLVRPPVAVDGAVYGGGSHTVGEDELARERSDVVLLLAPRCPVADQHEGEPGPVWAHPEPARNLAVLAVDDE